MPITINGSGTVTGISAGGLPDATVTPADLTQPLTLATAKTATGTAVDFTGIPSWVKRITVMFSGVSLSGSASTLVQIGDSGGIETTGYNSFAVQINTAATAAASNFTTGFVTYSSATAQNQYGMMIIANVTGNEWVAQHQMSINSDNRMLWGAGGKTLSDQLDRLRITSSNGTDTFDAGTINILYE